MTAILEWENLTGPRIAALDRARTVLLVASSPLEVHGPHLPVVTDCREAEGLMDRAAELLLERRPELTFVRLPKLWVATDVIPHQGSVSFRPSTVTRVLEEMGRSLARQGFQHLWVGNFHGGPRHFVAIEQACHRVHRRTGARMVPVFSLLIRELTGGSSDLAGLLGGIGGITAEQLKGDSHGGLIETALLLHLAGPHVDPSYVSLPPNSLELKLAREGQAPLQRGAKPTFFELVRSFPLKQRYYQTETYAGAPAQASAELGRAYLDIIAGKAAGALESILDGRRPMSACHSPLWPLRHVLLNPMIGALFDRFTRGSSPLPV